MELNIEFLLSFSVIIFAIFVGYKLIKWQSQKEWDSYKDDGKPIIGEQNMIIHCEVVHDDIGFYQTMNCLVCPYRNDECLKYRHRHNGKTPIEMVRGYKGEDKK